MFNIMNNYNTYKPDHLPTPKQNRNSKNFNRTPNNTLPQSEPRNTYNRRPYFSDGMLLSRVSLYLSNNGGNGASGINFHHMVDEFQKDYREYRRRKRSGFIQQLKKATEIVTVENSLNNYDDHNGDNDDDFGDEYCEDENGGVRGRKSPDYAFEGDGDINSALEDSYLRQNAKRRKLSDSGTGMQELISIVTSDEDENDDSSAIPAPEKGREHSSENKAAPNSVPEVTSTPLVKPAAPETQAAKRRRVEATQPGSKRFKSTLEPVRPRVTFKDMGGNEKVLQEVTQLLIHMRHPEVYRVLGVSPPRGFLLHGPPGSGKTLLAHAIAGELKVPLLKVAAPELVGGLSGQSEERIRDLFEQGVALAPCILFIDEVDAITPNRETAHREMERRIVAQLLSSLDELSNNENGDQVLVIGATNRPDSLDPALRRAGRFDREVCLGIPDRESRESILHTVCHSLRLAPQLQLSEVAMMTPGFVGADLKALVTEAAIAAVNRLFKTLNENESKIKTAEKPVSEKTETSKDTKETMEEREVMIVIDEVSENNVKTDASEATGSDKTQPDKLDEGVSTSNIEDEEIQVVDTEDEVQVVTVQVADSQAPDQETEPSPPSLLHSAPLSKEQLQEVYITMEDFRVALKAVQPSSKREGFATVPDVKWEDIGSLKDIRHELEMAILAPVKYPQEFATMGLNMPTGVLLCGPPGCGKTLLAKAVANEAGINFISVKGPELLNMYVGESERAVRQCFQRARSSQPCVIFFDEIDALCPKRTNMENGASRVVNQLLTEMDGMEARPGVFLMAATNRPDIVDPAVMRPGRLDKVLYVGLPAGEDRVDILRALTKGGKRPALGEDVDLADVAHNTRCEGYTGADLAALVREASMQALREFMASGELAIASLKVSARHFTMALEKIRPSVSDRDKRRYEDLRLQYAAVPSTA